MTNDFKEKLLKYITGNIEMQTGNNEPIFEPVETVTNNLDTYVWTNYGLSGRPVMTDIIKGNKIDNYLVYGTGSDENNNWFGFIIILNSNFEIITSTNRYTSGTLMNEFVKLKQNENGGFYGIDTDGTHHRFIMLNNILLSSITQNDYQYVMKKTYDITSNYPAYLLVMDIIKNPNASDYFIYGYNMVGHARPCAIEYKINVGSANEWTQFDYSSGDNVGYAVTSGFANWDSNSNLTFKLVGNIETTTNTKVRIYERNGSTIALTNTYDLEIDTSGFGTWDGLTFKSVILNEKNIYILAFMYGDNNKAYIYRIDNENLRKLYESNVYSGNLGNVMTIGLKTDSINTYFWYLVPTSNTDGIYYGGLIVNDNVFQTTMYEGAILSQSTYLNGYNQFNLYNLMLQAGDTLYKTPFVFNQFNYNGLAYENINCLVPSNVVLLNNDEEPKIIFARNLYNKTINDNTTVSTVQVPNTFLNDDIIQNKTLYSETNVPMDFDLENITKNIYETLNINFFNTINIMNNNDENNPLYNQLGAIRLNNSISQNVDYNNSQIRKIKINYADNTNVIKNIETPTITSNTATYHIVIYADKEINNIEMISADENTIYQTITGEFTIGKYYKITQNLRVE
jgi:hypothetical protein